MSPLHFIAYAIVLIFIIAVLARIIRIAKMPIHLRWELYPVPHEKGKAHYGGSILEESNWWEKPREKDLVGEMMVMIPEILLLKGVWEHNRKLWFGSFPLHFGLYLLIGNIALSLLAAGFGIFNITLPYFNAIIPVLAWAGCIIGLIGAIIMLFMRMFDSDLSAFSTPSHYFNILVLGALYFTGLLWAYVDPMFYSNHVGVYESLLTASAMPPAVPLVGFWSIGLTLFFVLYLPFTHMTHFFTKYFTYHSIRWEDMPNLPETGLQEKLNKQLGQVVTWSAPHVGSDGKKNWVDIATSAAPKTKKENA